MAALAEMELDTLTPEQAAARQALAALETLRAENETLTEEKACLAGRNEAQAERIRRLEHLNLELVRLLYGRRSEKLSADERQLAFEELEGASAEVEAAAAPEDPPPARSRKRHRPARNLGHLPAHLPRIEQVVEPESTLCPCGCGEMVQIGEDRTERLDIVPAQLRVIVTVRPKYACRICEEGVTQAPTPARLIEGGLPTEGAIAHVLISKYADHCPLHRQAQIYARSGLELDRSTLAGWVGKAAFHLGPVYDCLKKTLKTSSTLGLDETTVRVLDPGRGKTKTGYLWTMVRDERSWSGADPPGVVYEYAPGRSGSPIAKEALRRIAQLYAIEDRIRGEPPATRQFVRWTEAAPLANAFGVWLDEQRSRISPKPWLGEKLSYIANNWERCRSGAMPGGCQAVRFRMSTRRRPTVRRGT